MTKDHVASSDDTAGLTLRASLSGTSSKDVVNRCLEFEQDSHSEHRFPAPSSKLCQNWLHHLPATSTLTQLLNYASALTQTGSSFKIKGALSSREIKGALLSPRSAAVHRRGQRPPKGLGTSKTVEAT